MSTTLQSCVDEYQAFLKTREDDEAKRREETERETEAYTKEAFENIGLTPKRIDGRVATFDYEGKEVNFIVSKWKYSNSGVYRLLDETCNVCESHFATDEMCLDKQSIGYMLANPQRRYHECFGFIPKEDSKEEPVERKSPREVFMDAMDEYIRSVAQSQVDF